MGKRKRTTKARRPVIAVATGQVYRVPRPGKVAARIRVSRVLTSDRRQPKVLYQVISKSGKPTKRTWYRIEDKATGKPKRRELKRMHWLQWRDGAWRLPGSWELAA